MNNDSNRKVAGALIVGGLVGAGVALLFAPQSGRRTRRDIRKFTTNVTDEARDMIEDAAESIHDLSERISGRLSDLSSSGRELSEDARRKIVKTLENLQKTVGRQKEKLVG